MKVKKEVWKSQIWKSLTINDKKVKRHSNDHAIDLGNGRNMRRVNVITQLCKIWLQTQDYSQFFE